MQHPKLLGTPHCKKFALLFFDRTLACVVSRAKGFCNISGWRKALRGAGAAWHTMSLSLCKRHRTGRPRYP